VFPTGRFELRPTRSGVKRNAGTVCRRALVSTPVNALVGPAAPTPTTRECRPPVGCIARRSRIHWDDPVGLQASVAHDSSRTAVDQKNGLTQDVGSARDAECFADGFSCWKHLLSSVAKVPTTRKATFDDVHDANGCGVNMLFVGCDSGGWVRKLTTRCRGDRCGGSRRASSVSRHASVVHDGLRYGRTM